MAENSFDIRTIYSGDDDAMRTTFEAYVQWLIGRVDRAQFPRDEDVRALARARVGYFGGYFSVEKQQQAERVLDAAHPVFGKVGGPQEPKSAREAFALGLEIGSRLLRTLERS